MEAASDVAIVGAGITGVSLAYHLGERGVERVVVYERTAVGSGQSGVQPGGVRQQWGTRVNVLLARESLAFYRDLASRLEPRVDPRFRACGYLFLAHSHEALAALAASVRLQNELAVPSRLLSPAEAAELVPGLAVESVVGAAYCAEDGYFDRPQSVVEAFADAAQRRGVRIETVRVDRLEPEGSSWRLVLGDGSRASASDVVVAAGYDAPALLAPLGVELPIRKEGRYLFYSDPISAPLLEPLLVSAERRLATKQLADGRVLASDLGAAGDPDAERERWRANVRAAIHELLPALEYVSFPLLVEGFYDTTPDHQAMIGSVPAHDGLWLAAGFSGHGFMLAPAVGARLATTIAGGRTDDVLADLAPDRFARGRATPEPQVV